MENKSVKLNDLRIAEPIYAHHPDAVLEIEFEDKGQDFLKCR